MTEKITTSPDSDLENMEVTPETAPAHHLAFLRNLNVKGSYGRIAAALLGLATVSGCAEVRGFINDANEGARARYGIQFIRNEKGEVVGVDDSGARVKEAAAYYGEVTAGAGASVPGGVGFGVTNSATSYQYKEPTIFNKDNNRIFR